ncbi:MAG: hypothetical protein L6Q29_02935 [Candidatus Pacebacteria bacterium]|nr:hypothetical protein [Candidatus Paceibacterota bacterium]
MSYNKKMFNLGKYVFLGIILFLISGVATTKLTVRNQVDLSEAEIECKHAGWSILYDNPIEQLGIRVFGSTIVEEKVISALRIKAYTLFRIPIGESVVYCDSGPSYKIPQTQEGIKRAIKETQYCEVKSDCAQVQSKCPFGCYTFVNKKDADRIQAFIDSYESTCIYSCVELAGYDCVNNKCEVIYPNKGINREALFENCAKDIPRENIDDTSLNQFEKIVTIWWWDDKLQDNVSFKLPYEPENGFAGCSESVKTLLRHIQETAENETKDNL